MSFEPWLGYIIWLTHVHTHILKQYAYPINQWCIKPYFKIICIQVKTHYSIS